MKQKVSKFKLFAIMLLLATSLTSCYTTKEGWHMEQSTVDDFPAFRKMCIGQSHNQIVTKLGAPQRTLSDGAGGTILVYENTTTTTVSNSVKTAYNVDYFNKTYTPGVSTTSQQTTNTDYIQYFVNSESVCYDVKTNIPMTHVEDKKVYGKYKVFNRKAFWITSIAVAASVSAAIICGSGSGS